MERRSATRYPREQNSCAPLGEEDSEDSAKQSQQDTFREKLTSQPDAAGAERQAHGNFLFPRRCAREEKISDVGASNQQNQGNHGHQNVQRLRIANAQGRNTRVTRDKLNIGPTDVLLSIGG